MMRGLEASQLKVHLREALNLLSSHNSHVSPQTFPGQNLPREARVVSELCRLRPGPCSTFYGNGFKPARRSLRDGSWAHRGPEMLVYEVFGFAEEIIGQPEENMPGLNRSLLRQLRQKHRLPGPEETDLRLRAARRRSELMQLQSSLLGNVSSIGLELLVGGTALCTRRPRMSPLRGVPSCLQIVGCSTAFPHQQNQKPVRVTAVDFTEAFANSASLAALPWAGTGVLALRLVDTHELKEDEPEDEVEEALGFPQQHSSDSGSSHSCKREYFLAAGSHENSGSSDILVMEGCTPRLAGVAACPPPPSYCMRWELALARFGIWLSEELVSGMIATWCTVLRLGHEGELIVSQRSKRAHSDGGERLWLGLHAYRPGAVPMDACVEFIPRI